MFCLLVVVYTCLVTKISWDLHLSNRSPGEGIMAGLQLGLLDTSVEFSGEPLKEVLGERTNVTDDNRFGINFADEIGPDANTDHT